MRRAQLECYQHPRTRARLTLRVDREQGGDVLAGALVGDGDEFSIVDGLPRFCPLGNYADSFGYQWRHFATTQLDSKADWGAQSERRLFGETGWPADLRGQRVLEAGSGMGRFTEVLAATGAEVCTFDYSRAIDANYDNNRAAENVSFCQADIYAPPYAPASFDKVLCVGVLQHCPSPKRAFQSLVRLVRPGGEIFVDCYRLFWKSPFLGKYYLRPLTRRLPPRALHRFVRFHVGWVYPLTGLLHRLIGRRARSVSWALAMADHRGQFPVGDAKARELCLLDTFDMLAPAYDRPRTLGVVRRWFEEAGLVDIHVRPGINGVAAGGRKPSG